MSHSHDLRGSRRLSLLCDFVNKVFKDSLMADLADGSKTLQSLLAATGPLLFLKPNTCNSGFLWQPFDWFPTYSVHQVDAGSSYKPGFLSRRKRSCNLKTFLTTVKTTCGCYVTSRLKSATSTSTIKISPFTVIQVIVVPLAIIGVDIGTDGNFLRNMWPETNLSTGKEEVIALDMLFLTSASILVISLMNLIGSNPLKSLIRSARTSTLMRSRKAESEDVALPIGN